MMNVLALVCSRMLMAYVWFCYGTSVYEITDKAENSLRETWDVNHPTVYTFWHDEFVLLSLNAYCKRIQYPVCITNDSFGGRMVAAAWKGFGAPVVTIGLGESREERIQRITEALRKDRRMVIAADYGRPWFKARPTSAQLAQAVGGSVVAMHLSAKRPLIFKWQDWQLQLPTPFNHYTLHLSEPMSFANSDELWRLRRAAPAPRELVEERLG